jgi:dihydroneopterin aldolase
MNHKLDVGQKNTQAFQREKMTTKLLLKNMVFYGHHGVYAAERELGQKIEVDVELYSDFCAAGADDDLGRTVNYPEVYAMVKEIVETGQYNLIEAIATAVLKRVTAAYQLERVTVRVRKPQPPVGGLMDAVEYEVTNSQSVL